MPTTQTVSKDPVLEAHVFWHRFRTQIVGAIVLAIVVAIGYAGYRFYHERQESDASAFLAAAKNAHDYAEVMSRYPDTAAGASASLLLGQKQRSEGKFTESSATLQAFIDKNPKHELASAAKMAIAANLESMGKMDEALVTYQQVAAKYPTSFNAPLALLSEVPLLKAKGQEEAARRVCETVITQYKSSLFASEAMQELGGLKPSASSQPGIMPASPTGTTGPPAAPRPPMALPSAAPKPGAAPTVKPKP